MLIADSVLCLRYTPDCFHCVQRTSARRAYMWFVDWWAASAAAVTHLSRGRVVQDEEPAELRFLDTYKWFNCRSWETSEHGVAVVNTRHDYCKHKLHCDIISSTTANLALDREDGKLSSTTCFTTTNICWDSEISQQYCPVTFHFRLDKELLKQRPKSWQTW